MGDDSIQNRLIELFRVEAAEHLSGMQACLDTFASADVGDPSADLERIFRNAHSLKGAARAVDERDIERICQELETHFSALRRSSTAPSANLLALFQETVDLLSAVLGGTHSPEAVLATVERLKLAHDGLSSANPAATARPSDPVEVSAPDSVRDAEPAPKIDTTRTSVAELDRLFRRSEEAFSVCLAQEAVLKRVAALRTSVRRERDTITAVRTKFRGAIERRDMSKRYSEKLDERLADRVTELDTLEAECGGVLQELTSNYRQLRASVSDLLDGVSSLQMLPIRLAFEHLPRTVRALSRDCGKQVAFELRGDEVRIDKRILENLRDPILHLVRNAVDHGIESPAERLAAGKPEGGTLVIDVAPVDAGMISIRISDDGRGINTATIRAAAVEAGELTHEESDALADEEVFGLIFRSGLSTSPIVTDLSGRGLGLAIVQEKVAALEGSIRCQSSIGKGTAFVLRLPTSLATTRVVEVETGDHRYFIPASFVSRTLRASKDALHTVGGRLVLENDARPLPAAFLRDVLNLGGATSDALHISVVVLRSGEIEAAVLVDRINCERETIVKPLGPQLRVAHVSSASIGAGGVVTIVLNAAELVHATARGAFSTDATRSDVKERTARRTLVVDDSVTSRALLRDIFASAGYRVETAVDGMDAFMKLREGEFELVISDVDMPRLNGFELVRKIRQDRKLEDIPVILVTSLDSREDRERGIEVGANAYIVKTRFDQSNLLEVAGRFA